MCHGHLCFPTPYVGPSHGNSSLSREAHTLLSPATSPSSPRIIQRCSQTSWEIWALQRVLGLPRGLLSDGHVWNTTLREASLANASTTSAGSSQCGSFPHLSPSGQSTLVLLRTTHSDLQEQIFIPAASHVAVNVSARPGGQVMRYKRL